MRHVSVRGRNVYLSGPMTGMPGENYASFANACQFLRKAGAGDIFNPAGKWKPGLPHGWYMRHDLRELTRSTIGGLPYYGVLVSLPGWEASTGAYLERLVAGSCEIECVDLAEVARDG